MQIKEVILESLSRTAFHYTNTKTALTILKSGEFQLSGSLGSIEQQYAPKGYPYFMSTTRTRHGGYHKSIGDQAVLFVLDGNWFNNHYISRPMDYWENRNPTLGHHRDSEAEDRVFSKQPTIPIGGVTAVHFYCAPEAAPEVKAWTRQALIAAKRRGIAAYFYTDKEAWRNFDSRNQGDISTLTGQERTGGYLSRHKGYLVPWMELIQAKERSQLSKKAESLRYSLQYGYNKDDATYGLKTDLSNARKPNGGADRVNAVKMIKFMQQNGLTTVNQLVDALADKWKSDSINEYVNAETVKTGFQDQQVVGDVLLTAEGEDRKVYDTNVNILHIRALDNTPERKELAWTDFLVKRRHEDGEPYLEAAYVYVSPSQRGKGLAKLMYQYANSTLGNDIEPSAMQTDMGKGMWTGLDKSIRKLTPLKPAEPETKPGLLNRIKNAFKEDSVNVTEAFDQPYKLKWEKGDHGDIDAYAQLDDGNYLSIMFNKEHNTDKEEAWSVEFYRNNSQEVTGEGDAQRVFATVLSAIQTFIKKYKPNRIIFSASKEVEQGQKSQSRARLYDSLVQRYARSWGFRAFRADAGNKVIYELSRSKPMAENFADGKHPEDKGDSKRYGVPTKASVSTLRKVAKQGGRKGQLAHWMANMKAGRAKAKK